MAKVNLFAVLDGRQAISTPEYEGLHGRQIEEAISQTSSFRFSHLSEEELKKGYRYYRFQAGKK